MIGLGYILLFWLYFWVIKVAVKATMSWAESRNCSARRWGWATAIGLLSIVFWDAIPVYTLHAYQCSQNAGFTVHKTLDEWQRENPGVAETLIPNQDTKTIENGELSRVELNQRFAWDITLSQIWQTVYKEHNKIVDLKTGDVLAERIDFYTNLKSPIVTPTNNLGDFKIWMNIPSCEEPGSEVNKKSFYRFEASIENLGRNK